jgi:hypothetical protein
VETAQKGKTRVLFVMASLNGAASRSLVLAAYRPPTQEKLHSEDAAMIEIKSIRCGRECNCVGKSIVDIFTLDKMRAFLLVPRINHVENVPALGPGFPRPRK